MNLEDHLRILPTTLCSVFLRNCRVANILMLEHFIKIPISGSFRKLADLATWMEPALPWRYVWLVLNASCHIPHLAHVTSLPLLASVST